MKNHVGYPPSKPELKWSGYGRERPILVEGAYIGQKATIQRALGGFVAPSRAVMEGGGGVEWEEVAETPPDRRAEGARPVGSHHGSYQCVWYGFGPQMGRHMCHAGWLSQSTEPIVDGDRWPDVVKSPPGGRWWAGGRLVIVGGPRQGACHGRGPGWWRACAMVVSPPTPTPR